MLRHAAQQEFADRIAVPDADDQQFGVVAFHRGQQFVSGVNTDGLGHFELHAGVGEVRFHCVYL